ncbi:MAG: hypothetical protein AMQ74_01918 [Candidatus Methanofastidiosum methylothiophilum]|uniref:Uncharacterized protein n=1 Tax=Candidatus Methanofastidiosum methylothiophilum TaxID=1705564 RepID=A0A150IJ63_9EURY|nr:MAG: hypothetical protein AMQ74_01918 [Candidatus Methanofastidiosum methylthiophilus]
MYEAEIIKKLWEYYKDLGYRVTSPRSIAPHRFDLVYAEVWKGQVEKLGGVEIKTDRDSFTRIESQIFNYAKYLDEVYLCLETREEPKNLPRFVGVLRAKEDSKEIKFCRMAKPIDYNYFSPTGIRSKGMEVTLRATDGAYISKKRELIEYANNWEYLKKKFLFNSMIKNPSKSMYEEKQSKKANPWMEEEDRIPIPLTEVEMQLIDFVQKRRKKGKSSKNGTQERL